jgi:diketogulonate reductase-like aldo/keto reductase
VLNEHSEQEDVHLVDIWKKMEALVDAGLVRSIGVSNFRLQDLRSVVAVARIKPSINQIEGHPHLQQQYLVDFCHRHGIDVSVYVRNSAIAAASRRA